MSLAFYVLLLLPSVAFAFLILMTFYGEKRAYFALSWIPLALFLLIRVFQQQLSFEHSPLNWPSVLLLAIAWTSLVQAGLGIALAIRAFHRRESFAGILLATCLVIIPFIFRA